VLLASWLVTAAVFLIVQLSSAGTSFNVAGTLFFGTVPTASRSTCSPIS
jgi:hypothetical protein